MITYRILSYDKGAIIVQYSKGDRVLSTHSFDIPLTPEGLFISAEELDRQLTAMMPTTWVNRLEAIERGIPNEEAIKALVQPIETPPIEQPEGFGLQEL